MKTRYPASFQAGEWIGGTPYRVVRPLGIGGMGEVYEVDHTRTGTRRAIKVIRASLGLDDVLAQRLVREGRILRSIEHPNVVRVFEAGTLPDARPYFAMELLEGTSLRRLASKHAPLPWTRAIALIVQVLDGLEAVHRRGMIHRDVKPSNLFLDAAGTIKVLDLGIAKSTDPHATGPRTREGVLIGTTRYMAPEQLLGRPADARADVYASALVLFELLAGCHPSDAMTNGEDGLLDRVGKPPPRVTPWVRTALPSGLDEVLQRALAIDPDERFDSAAALATALRVFVSLPAEAPVPRARGPVARLQYDVGPPCAETRDSTTLPWVPRVSATPWWAFVHAAGVLLSLAALATAAGVTWMAARDLRWAHDRCTGALIDSSDASGAEHVGDGAGGR
jgi:eukaryotic-like serine/threonine-protein kinase